MVQFNFARNSRALSAAALVTAACLIASPAAAACKEDSGGGCERDGLACSPPDNGKCYTVKQERVLKCMCLAAKPAARTAGVSPALEYRKAPAETLSRPTATGTSALGKERPQSSLPPPR